MRSINSNEVKMLEKFMLNNIAIFVNEEHRFGTDAVLLADFAGVLPSHTVCDLCSGCGIIPLSVCRKKPPKLIYAVELQKEAAELLKLSVKENALEDKIIPICADLRNRDLLKEKIPAGSIDIVTVNPPYYKENSGRKRVSEAQRLARHEIACSLEQVLDTANMLLKYGGCLKICYPPDRLSELFCEMEKRLLAPKRLALVCNKQGEKPWLTLVSAKKGGKTGLTIDAPLIMRSENGEYTEKVKKIYMSEK